MTPEELQAALTTARLRVNDWHACASAEELARWRADQASLIVAAKASVYPEVEALSAKLQETQKAFVNELYDVRSERDALLAKLQDRETELGRETELRRAAEKHNRELRAALEQHPYPDEYESEKMRADTANAKLQEVEKALALFQKKAHDWWVEADRYLAQRDELTVKLQEAEQERDTARIAAAEWRTKLAVKMNELQEVQAERDTLSAKFDALIKRRNPIRRTANPPGYPASRGEVVTPQEQDEKWQPVPVPLGDGRHDIGDERRAAIVQRLMSDWSRDPDLKPEKVRQLAQWAGASVRALFHELGTLQDLSGAEPEGGEVVKACPRCVSLSIVVFAGFWTCGRCGHDFTEPALWQRVTPSCR